MSTSIIDILKIPDADCTATLKIHAVSDIIALDVVPIELAIIPKNKFDYFAIKNIFVFDIHVVSTIALTSFPPKYKYVLRATPLSLYKGRNPVSVQGFELLTEQYSRYGNMATGLDCVLVMKFDDTFDIEELLRTMKTE